MTLKQANENLKTFITHTQLRKLIEWSLYFVWFSLTIELKATTSPATLLSEDSLTYLNQDQPYTIEISDSHGDKPAIIKVICNIFAWLLFHRVWFEYAFIKNVFRSTRLNISHFGETTIQVKGCWTLVILF